MISSLKRLKYLTKSDKETVTLGIELGNLLVAGDVVALMGGLGSGKTWFTKGIALGLGFGPETLITSPSFAIVNEYEAEETLFHMDLYRLNSQSDFLASGLDEYMGGNSIVVMEWADRWPEILPEWRIEVHFNIIDILENLSNFRLGPHASVESTVSGAV